MRFRESFSKRLKLMFLSTLILLTLTLKSVWHIPHGGDTWASTIRVIALDQRGYLPTYLHPLSYFGWYPYSYPHGYHFFITSAYQITGLNLDILVIILPILVGEIV